MSLWQPSERRLAECVSQLVHCNPLTARRIELEREALGTSFRDEAPDWNKYGDSSTLHENVVELVGRTKRLLDAAKRRLAADPRCAVEDELAVYEDAVVFWLYHAYRDDFYAATDATSTGKLKIACHDRFARDASAFLNLPGLGTSFGSKIPHLFSLLFQVARAFVHIFRNIVGISQPAADLRASVWHSIFTHNLRRYRRSLFSRMGDITTLITGPSGTGKELAARAIAMSRYVPFDVHSGSFPIDSETLFLAQNLSALSPTLIESELFGHSRGAFTGAVSDRVGLFESCADCGSVFLDEIGDLEPNIQIKLLRVLQTRTLQRIGDGKYRTFNGKIIAATNRDLRDDMTTGRFRTDLYYRLCADVVVTPSLCARLRDTPAELAYLTRFIARRLVAEDADSLAADVLACVEQSIPPTYSWPGNVRELEQCVRNVLVRGEYGAADDRKGMSEPMMDEFIAAVSGCSLDANQFLSGYCSRVYEMCGSYVETARRVGLDRRTVRSRVSAWHAAGGKRSKLTIS